MRSTILGIIVLGATVLPACQVAQKSLRSGHYDKAFYKALKKVRRNKADEAHILILEEAYKKANFRDQNRINFLKKEGQPDSWMEIFDIYKAMKVRQQRLRPLLPLSVRSQSRQAKFELKNYDQEMIKAKKNAAEFLYNHALMLLRKKDRLAARDAYEELLQVKKYYSTFRDVDRALEKARELGTNKVLVTMINTSGVPLPPGFEKELTTISVQELNKDWLSYHTTRVKNVNYDYHITVKMKSIRVSPERIREKEFTETKRIDDGWDYVRDEDGEPKKDKDGEPIRVKKFRTISCRVVEVHQEKIATIAGSVDYLDKRRNQLVRSFPIATDAVFSDLSFVPYGDLDALSPETRKKINKRPLPFPSDFALLMQAGQILKPVVKDLVWDNHRLVKF